MGYKYLAIDESGTGQSKEYYVIAYSNNNKQLEKGNRKSKTRKKSELPKLDEEVGFNFIIHQRDILPLAHPRKLELIIERLTRRIPLLPESTIVIDGILPQQTLNQLYTSIKNPRAHSIYNGLEIKPEVNADRFYPLARIADQVAYWLFSNPQKTQEHPQRIPWITDYLQETQHHPPHTTKNQTKRHKQTQEADYTINSAWSIN